MPDKCQILLNTDVESDRENQQNEFRCVHFTTTFEFEYEYKYSYLYFSEYRYRIIRIPFPYFHFLNENEKEPMEGHKLKNVETYLVIPTLVKQKRCR
jgi:hypothetical protein